MLASLRARGPIILMCAWCLTVLTVRMVHAGSDRYGFMAWNLFLAVVPLVMALLFRAVAGRGAAAVLSSAILVAWLAFLPNAPYMVTDLVHLESRPPVPLWYDIVLFGSFAATGILLAYTSVAEIEAVLRQRIGKLPATAVAYGSLAVCGFGIYLGRFLRWNSWDIVTSPYALLGEIVDRFADPMAHSRTWAVTVLYGAALVLGYLAMKGAALSMSAAMGESADARASGRSARPTTPRPAPARVRRG